MGGMDEFNQKRMGGKRAKPDMSKIVLLAFVVLGLVFLPSMISSGSENEIRVNARGKVSASVPQSMAGTKSFRIGVVTDLDKQSKDESAKKPSFKSIFQTGTLSKTSSGVWGINWDDENTLVSAHNEAGRGMELSELMMFGGKLFTVDDRTGIVFEIINGHTQVAPRYIAMEGNGDTDKGAKLEWMTQKDGVIYAGSFGKEYVNNDGSIKNRNNLWVSVIDRRDGGKGSVMNVDWTENYNALRRATDTVHPGYMIIEALEWSTALRRWVCLPRRVSTQPYDEVLDEQRGSNTLLLATEDFSEVEVRHATPLTPTRGFSSFKFVPGSGDVILAALKSEENEDDQTQSSFLTVFDLNGNVLMEETEIPGGHKYEGLVFL